jgi:hypothetical protein
MTGKANYDKDGNSRTTYDPTKADHGIEKPIKQNNQLPNDNRDKAIFMDQGTIDEYNTFQSKALSATSAVAKLVESGGQKYAVAEVVLTTTTTNAGDNYQVRATTVNPNGKPFNMSGSNLSSRNPTDYAGIDAAKIVHTGVLTAWKRVYYEQDVMYSVGSSLGANAAMGQNKVKVDPKKLSLFTVGDMVRVLDTNGREQQLLKVTAKNETTNELTLDGTLVNDYTTANYGFVGKETGNAATDFLTPDTSKLTETFNDAYTEVDITNAGRSIATYEPPSRTAWGAFSLTWFKNQKKPDYFQLVGAGRNRYNVKQADGLTDNQVNISWVWTLTVLDLPISAARNREITNHEIVHQFDPAKWGNAEDEGGHNHLKAYDDSVPCLMNEGTNALKAGSHKETDPLILSLDRIYMIRDRDTPI